MFLLRRIERRAGLCYGSTTIIIMNVMRESYSDITTRNPAVVLPWKRLVQVR